MRQTILAFIGVAALSIPATAQHPLLTSGLEVRSFAGAYLPTGAQYTDFKPGAMFGAQLADEISEHYHVLGSLAWADGRNKFASLAQSRTSIWQYDIGVEANANAWLNETWLLRPLVGVGVGGRIYDYRLANVDTYSCSVGYASVGSELQRGLVAFRFDARDYVTCFKSPLRSGSTTRNDVTLTFGFVYHIR